MERLVAPLLPHLRAPRQSKDQAPDLPDLPEGEACWGELVDQAEPEWQRAWTEHELDLRALEPSGAPTEVVRVESEDTGEWIPPAPDAPGFDTEVERKLAYSKTRTDTDAPRSAWPRPRPEPDAPLLERIIRKLT